MACRAVVKKVIFIPGDCLRKLVLPDFEQIKTLNFENDLKIA